MNVCGVGGWYPPKLINFAEHEGYSLIDCLPGGKLGVKVPLKFVKMCSYIKRFFGNFKTKNAALVIQFKN